jgi:two-component system, NtrC family, response regulator PilR
VGGGTTPTVLVLDDDESLRFLCRVNLELDGYRVLEGASLAEGRVTLAAEHVDAILLDVHLGDGDGRELLRELGSDRPAAALFTGTEPAGGVEGLADAVIPKPFELGLLRSTVDRLVSQGVPQVDSAP